MMDFADPAYEAEYNLRARHADADALIGRWTAASTRSRAALGGGIDERYGEGSKATLDFFPAREPGSPVLVFIHGGYWRRMDKIDHSFVADVPVAAGAAVAVINYDLCPTVTIDTIVAQCRAAIAWVYHNAKRFNGDPDRIFVSGHSAGGHLTAMTIATDWKARGLPADLIKGGLPISGIFDLHPIRRTSINVEARLDQESADRLSPIYMKPLSMPPIVAAVGAKETFGFIEQNRAFADRWRHWGGQVELLEVPNVHHFDVPLELARANSSLSRALLGLMGL